MLKSSSVNSLISPIGSPIKEFLDQGNFKSISTAHSEFVKNLLEKNSNSPKSQEEKEFFSREITRIPSPYILNLNKISPFVEISLVKSCEDGDANAVGEFLSSLRKTETLDSLFQEAFSKAPSLKDQLNILEELVKRGLNHYLELVDFPKYTLLKRLIESSIDESKIRDYFLIYCVRHDITLARVEEGKAFFKEQETFLEAIPSDAPLKEYLREMRILDKELLKVETSLVETAEALEISFELLKTFLQEKGCEIDEDLSKTLNTFLYTRFVSSLDEALKLNPNHPVLLSLQKTCDSKHDTQKKIASLKNILKGAKAGTPSQQKLKDSLILPYAQLRAGLPTVDPEKEASKALFDSLKTINPVRRMIAEEAYLRRHTPSLNWLLEEETYEDYVNLLQELSSRGEEVGDLLAKKQEIDLHPVSEKISETIQYIKTKKYFFSKELLLSLKNKEAPETVSIEQSEETMDLELFSQLSFSEKVRFLLENSRDAYLREVVEKGDHESVLACYEAFKIRCQRKPVPKYYILKEHSDFFLRNFLPDVSFNLEELKFLCEKWIEWFSKTDYSPLKAFMIDHKVLEEASLEDKVQKLKDYVELFVWFLQKEALEVGEVFHPEKMDLEDLESISKRSKEILYKKFLKELTEIELKYANDTKVIGILNNMRKFKGENKATNILKDLDRCLADEILNLEEICLLKESLLRVVSNETSCLNPKSLDENSTLQNFFRELGVIKNPALSLEENAVSFKKMLGFFVDSLKKALGKFEASPEALKQLDIALKKQDLGMISLIAEHVGCLEYRFALLQEDVKAPSIKNALAAFPKKTLAMFFSRKEIDKIADTVHSLYLPVDKKSNLQDLLKGQSFISSFKERQEKEKTWFFSTKSQPVLNQEDWRVARTEFQKQLLLDQAFQSFYSTIRREYIRLDLHFLYFYCLEAAFSNRDIKTMDWISKEITYAAHLAKVKSLEVKGRDVSLLYKLHEEVKDLSIEDKLKEILRRLDSEEFKSSSYRIRLDKEVVSRNFSSYVKETDENSLFFRHLVDERKENSTDPSVVFCLYKGFIDKLGQELLLTKTDKNEKTIVFLRESLEDLSSVDFFQLDRIALAIRDPKLTSTLVFAFSEKQIEKGLELLSLQPKELQDQSHEEFLKAFKGISDQQIGLEILAGLQERGMTSYIACLMERGSVDLKKIGYRFLKENILENKGMSKEEKLAFFLENYLDCSSERSSLIIKEMDCASNLSLLDEEWIKKASEHSSLKCFLENEGFFLNGRMTSKDLRIHTVRMISYCLVNIVFPYLKYITEDLGIYAEMLESAINNRDLEEFDKRTGHIVYEMFLTSLKMNPTLSEALEKIDAEAENYEQEMPKVEKYLEEHFPEELEKLRTIQRMILNPTTLNTVFWGSLASEENTFLNYLNGLGVKPVEFLSPAENVVYAKIILKEFVDVLFDRVLFLQKSLSEKVDALESVTEEYLNFLAKTENFKEIADLSDLVVYLECKQFLKEFKISYKEEEEGSTFQKIQKIKEFVLENPKLSTEQINFLKKVLEGGLFYSKRGEVIENQIEWLLNSSFKNDFLSIIGNPDTSFYRKYVAVQKTFQVIAASFKKELSNFDPIYLRILDFAYVNQHTDVLNWLFSEILLNKHKKMK